MKKIELVITSRERDLGGFSVRRILPYAKHRLVGPFVFFDHMGPATFPPGRGITVRPHPHIHLATVTYLFEGKILHRDSLGCEQEIEPGAINWMTAGHGIVHSERAPADFLEKGGRLNGIQVWVALPREFEEVNPSFAHQPKDTLPSFLIDGVNFRLLVGSAYGLKSPVPVYSNLFYLEAIFPAGASVTFPTEGREAAVYVASGKMNVEGEEVAQYSMAIAGAASELSLHAIEPSHVMLLGGESVGPRFIDWNFVSSSQENIERAKAEWRKGPGSARFPKVPGDEEEFIPLPDEPPPAKGTIM